MKFLSFRYNDKELYGVKVKREESAWDLIKVLEDFDNTDKIPQTLREALEIYGVSFIEKVRKIFFVLGTTMKHMLMNLVMN